MNKNSTKNFKVLALILLTSTLLIGAISPSISTVKAATTDSLYVYTTTGGVISANGTALKGGSSPTYNNGTVLTFTETPSADFQFLSWIYVSSAGPVTSTATSFSQTISTAACAIEAMFLPTTNATQTVSGSGTASIYLYFSAGGTTVPSSTPTSSGPATYTNYTVGKVSDFNAVASSGFKFLYWMVATSTVSTYTTSTLAYNVSATTCALQAFFIPTSSTVTLPTPTPKINEDSSATAIILAVILASIAFATYTYTKKAKK
ncbi:MAG: hypothetical protein ABSD42_13165 [Candidatus Bathyarchaeia archaeon]|jgi:hypothetical protein